AIVKPGGGGNSDINYTHTSSGSPLKLRMPDEPGDYEIVYVLNQSREVLTRKPITLKAVDASLDFPAEADAGDTIRVSWEGSYSTLFRSAIVEPGGGGNSDINYTHTSRGSPLKLRMPVEPGDYEIVYVLN